jgi:tetratricopeptide (TPR) repeat protein
MKRVSGVCTVAIAFCAASACIATKQSYVAKGNKLYAAGKYADAALNYRKAIQKDPNYGYAYYGLGMAAIKQNQAREAYDSLFRAVQLLPNDLDAKEKFADVCLSFYLANNTRAPFLYRQLKQLSDELLAANPNSYKGLVVRGYLASTDRQAKEAIEYFRKALRISRSEPNVTAQLVQLLLEDGQTPEAIRIATDLMAHQKTYGPIYDFMYRYYVSSGHMGEAENVLKAKVANNPKQADYIVELARHYASIQKPEEMRATLQRLIADPADFPQARLWVGDFYLGLRNFPEALRYYREGATASREVKQRTMYELRAVITLRAQGDRKQALEVAARALRENPTDADAMHLHANMVLEMAKVENANDAIREFQALLSRNPSDASLELQLGRAYRLKGDPAAAREHFQTALTKNSTLVEAHLELADLDLVQRQFGDALKQIDEAQRLQPNNAKAKLFHARVLIATGNRPDARAELTKLLKESPQDTNAQLELGVLAIMDRRYPDALEIFGKLRGADPRAAAGLAAAYAAQHQTNKAEQVMDEALKKWPDSPVLLDQMAGLNAGNGNYDGAISQFEQLLAKDPKNVQTLRHLGDIYRAKGDQAKAISVYQQASALVPSDVDTALTLADMLAGAGRNAEAKRGYEGILKVHPDNPGALNNLAFFLADSGGNLDEALRLVQQALAKVPNQAAFSDTVGYIYLKKGMTDSAMQTFGTLVRKNPGLGAFHYHLGLALYQKGERDAALKELNAALKLSATLSAQDKAKVTKLLAKIG